jgi:hypothetical protein
MIIKIEKACPRFHSRPFSRFESHIDAVAVNKALFPLFLQERVP